MRTVAMLCLSAVLSMSCGGGPSGGTDAGGGGTDSGGAATDAGTAGSCDLRASAGYCQEYFFAADALAVYHTSCDTNGGTWADAACPRAMALGGCGRTEMSFGETANWFYVGGPYTTADQVRMVCDADPAAHFIAP